MKEHTIQSYDSMIRANKRSKDKARQKARNSKHQFNENYYEVSDFEPVKSEDDKTTSEK